MSPVPKELQNKPFILLAELSVKPGKIERLLELMMPVVESANSDSEPGCLTYRLSKSVDDSRVIVYEEYANAEAHTAHTVQPAFQKLWKAKDEEDLVQSVNISFLDEMKN